MKRAGFVASLLIAAVIAGVPVQALGKASTITQAAQAAAAAPVTVKLTIVISRFVADKKTGSLPFVLMIVPSPVPTADTPPQAVRDGEQTNLQVGSSFPYTSTTVTDGKSVTSLQTYSLGTNVTASGRAVADGVYNVNVSVQDNQISSEPAPANTLPKFQNFRSTNRLILRDGQTIQYTAAADKASGEVIKLDVTLNVVK